MLVAISNRGGIRLAEVGFILYALAAIVLIVGAVPGFRRYSRYVVGVLFAVGSVLNLVAVGWGDFG
jgi:hypothetical protein